MSYTAKSEDDDVAQIFLEDLERDLRCIWSKKFKDPANMIFTEEDKRNYDKATKFISVVKMDLLKVTKRRTKSEIIVTYQIDLEEQHMRSVTVTTEYRSLYQWYFIIFRTMTIICLLRKCLLRTLKKDLSAYLMTRKSAYRLGTKSFFVI